MMNMEKKVYKEEVEWAVEIYFLKCLVEEWEEDNKDLKKGNQYSTWLNAPLKKYIKAKVWKFRLAEIGFAQSAMVKEVKMAQTQHVQDVKVEEWLQN